MVSVLLAVVTVTVNNSSTNVYLGAAHCKDALNVNWTLPSGAPNGTGLDKVQILGVRNASTCGSATVSDPDKVLDPAFVPTTATGQFTVSSAQQLLILSNASADGGTTTTCDDPTLATHTSGNPI